MSTLLLGSNFSGRSKWLADRRAQMAWPLSAALGPFPDLACTGLTSMVGEELVVAAMNQCVAPEAQVNLMKILGLEELLHREIHALSGGEAVRLALSSLIAQGVQEIHIDTSLEQLDFHWRRSILELLARPANPIANAIFIADNHLAVDELTLFNKRLQFQQNIANTDHQLSTINPLAASEYVHTKSAPPISVECVSFYYNRRSTPIFNQVSLNLEPGTPYFLTGDNGSGKTTFVKLLSGTLLPQKGVIRIGNDIFQPSKSHYRFAGVAFQNPDFQWTTQSVEGELKSAQCGFPACFVFQAVLPTFGIPEELFQANPNDLPFVLKKRLGITLSVMAAKPWLIFDEPTLGQDKEYRKAFAEFVRLILDQGSGVIMISHDTYFRSLFPKSKKLSFVNQTIVPG